MHSMDANKISDENNSFGEPSRIILCVLFKSCKLAAAYYNKYENMLFVLNEITDSPPEFPAIRSILREINPFHTITLGTPCDKFVKVLINILSGQYLQTSEEEHEVTIPKNMTLHTYDEYSFSSCENKVKMLRLLSEPPEIDENQRELYLNSLINFQFQLSIHALGTLLKFIEKSWISLAQEGESQPKFYHIYQLPLADRVFVDSTTFEGLQVFKEMNHDASFKRGTNSSSREGISLFRIFSKYCVSQVGTNELRNIMLNPIKNKRELKKRLDFIEFVLKPSSHGFVETMRDIIKNISELNMIFQKIQNAKGSHNDWKTLFKTIQNTLFLSDSCKAYVEDSQLLRELTEAVDEKLFGLEVCIDSAIDVNSTVWSIRPLIKSGLDASLDKVKKQRDQIMTHVKAAANVVVEQLPSYMKECALLYVPDAGHMVSIPKWEENCDVHQLRDYGFHFMFELQGHLHYKNALCQELDRQLGDIQTEISNHENRIIERVTGFVLRYNQKIRDPIKIIALMDGLISAAKVASERRYCRPSYNNENVIEIVGGRHPILEIIEPNYVSNDYCSGELYSKLKMITGPHTSGKSVYLKQTALLLYLAHIGSYLPATSANVTLLHSIHSRINSIETASLHLSAFTIDLTQMAQALHNAKSSSLVIMDEFGKGTTGHEGFALLMGALTNFLKRSSCPHVLVTSHFQVDQTFLNSPLIQYQKMEHIWDEKTNDIVFLYKVADGISKSYASEIADLIDLDRDIILRTRNILNCYNNLLPIQPLAGRLTQQCEIDNEFLTTFDIPEVDL